MQSEIFQAFLTLVKAQNIPLSQN